MMGFLWFWLVAVMIVGYVVLDASTSASASCISFSRALNSIARTTLASIGPVWDGNEVWLLAGGGTLYFAFPLFYASAFSGFYLPLMIVLWLLILRGISVELRNHIDVAFGARFSMESLACQRTARHLFERLSPTSFAACLFKTTATSFFLSGPTADRRAPGILDGTP